MKSEDKSVFNTHITGPPKSGSLHCSLIHEGLDLKFPKWNSPDEIEYRYCCIADSRALRTVNIHEPNFWNNEYLTSTREINNKELWNNDCSRCQVSEEAGEWDDSHRLHYANLGKKPRKNMSGPSDITIKLSSVCNLMCTTCGPEFSTTW